MKMPVMVIEQFDSSSLEYAQISSEWQPEFFVPTLQTVCVHFRIFPVI
jgi:hypothetical protein